MTRPLPVATQSSGAFWDATRDRRYLVQSCETCGRAVWYPRSLCPHCGGTSLGWSEASGLGEVHTFTVEHRPAEAFGTEPYVVALVDLAEGVRVMGNIVGCEPAEVAVGMAVELTWEPLEDGRHLPQWTPTN